VLDTWRPHADHLVIWGSVFGLQQDRAALNSPPWPHSFTRARGEHEVATAITIADPELALECHSLTTIPFFNPSCSQLSPGLRHPRFKPPSPRFTEFTVELDDIVTRLMQSISTLTNPCFLLTLNGCQLG
jgi:hypothetical protein